MAQNDDVIIVGSLSDKELRDSIDKLVDYVGNKTNDMAGKFTEGLDKMKLAMKDFAVTQKVSVDLMKEAWRNMSSSFDAMVSAQSTATGSTHGGGKPQYPDNTVGHLEETIRLEEKRRKEMQLNSDELRQQNKLLEDQKNKLKEQTTSEQIKIQKLFAKDFGAANAMSTKTLQQAEDKLQRLVQIQSTFRKSGLIDEAKMNRLQSAIDNVRTKIERLKQTAPKSIQDVLGMDENGVDAIARKMRALKAVTIDPNNAQQVKLLGDEYQRLSRLQSELLGRNIQHTKSNNYLAQSFGYIRNRIVYALTLGAITNFTKQIYEIRGQYELLERSLGVLVNSFEKGSQIFQELNTMAIESPFTLMELAGAAKQLTAYNFAANEVVDTTRRLADISAALGVPMERLTYNLGQIRAQTVLTARDARDFANAGLPIVKSLSDYYTELEGKIVSTGDVYDRMSKKMVSYTDVMSVLNKMTDQGGKFFEFQAKQAETLRVQMANLTLAYNNMLNEMGENNQTLLSLPIQGLKALLQNWSSVNRVLKNVILSLGFLRVAQMIAIRNNMAWAASAGHAARMMGFLANTVKGFFASIVAIANPWTAVFLGLFAVTDLIGQFRAARIELEKLNDEIRENATEASNSNIDWLNNKGNKATREAAKEGKLSAEQAAKAWESVEQQLNQSASSANALIGELWQIDNVNERVAKGFDYVERIQKAQAALQDLQEDTIELTSDKGWLGMFGEGLVSDLKDYQESLDGFKGTYQELQDILYTDKGTNNEIKINFKEFENELNTTAESINNFITAHGIKDPLQINEILSRVRAQIKTRNPEIKGELATLFDTSLDKRMSELTNGAVDKNASLWAMFMERLKHNSSATFQDITDEIYTESGKLTREQQNAVDNNLEYFKNTMPWYYNAVKDMVDDASRLKIQIGIAFNVQQLTDFQKQVQERIGKAPKTLDFGNDSMLPTQNDNLQTWVKTQQGAIKALQEQNKLYARDSSKWSKDQIKANDKEIQQRKNLLDLFNQSYEKEKKTKGKTSADYVAEAIKQELSIIKEMRSNYDKLRKAGVSDTDALKLSAQGYELTLERVNNVLQKFGISKFNASDFAGKNVRQLLDSLTKQRDTLIASGKVKTSSLKDLDVEIQKLTVDAKTYDMKKITDGLNSELGKLKDEYELAVELDANPELGSIFADYMGIDLNEIPKNAEEAVKKAQQYIDKILRENKSKEKIDIASLMGKDAFDKWIKSSGHSMEDDIVKVVDNYRQALHKMQVDESKKQMQEWAQLLEKYSEYEYKVTQIQKDAEREREIARKKGASQEILDAIDERERQELAKLSFEEFQKSPEWIVATGDLANMSKSAIGMLIEQLEKYKRSAKNLSPKQIKQLNTALSKLYKEQRKNNPFKAISNMLDEANERMATFDEDIEKTQKEIDNLTNKKKESIAEGIADDETDNKLKKAIKRLKELKKAREETGKVDASSWVSSINETIGAVQSAIGVFDDLAKAIGGVDNSDLDKVFSVVDKAGQGAAIGAQIGGGWGALIGGVAGAATGLISIFAGAANERITDKVEESERAVKRLELAYIDLEHAVNEAYGMATIGANMAAKANKELQLVELKRQLALERSRDSKNRDEDKIIDLQKQIKELEYDIADAVDSIVNDLLGISSVGDAMENMMDAFIDALRSGEDAMATFDENVDEMIANMVKKMFTTKILQPWFEEQWNKIQEQINQRAGDIPDKLAEIQSKTSIAKNADTTNNDSLVEALRALGMSDDQIGLLNWYNEFGQYDYGEGRNARLKAAYEKMLKEAEQKEIGIQKELTTATMPTTDDIRQYAELLRSGQPIMEENMQEVANFLRELGLMKDDASKNLSALQQGIQGITEDTAGALEAYMNGVSQQVYLQSDILTQIRDTILGFELDAQVATLSQMLLQLQQSYVVQQNIENLLQNVINPSGRAFMVELVS